MYYKDCKTKNDVINAVARDKALTKEIEGICKTNEIDDLLQELYLILLGKNEELILGLNERKEIKFYIIRIVISQFFSKSSKFYHQHKSNLSYLCDFNKVINDDIQNDIEDKRSIDSYMDDLYQEDCQENKAKKILFINKELEKLDWYSKELFLRYVLNNTTYTKMNEQLGISRISIWNTVTKVKKNFRKKYKNE